MSGDPGDGAPSVFINPKCFKFPINPFVAVELKAKE